MDEIKELIKSPVFWFVSVFVAFFLSLIANFAKDWILNFKSKYSEKTRNKRDKAKKEIEEKIEKAKNDEVLFNMYQNQFIYLKTRHILYLLFGYMLMCFSIYSLNKLDITNALIFLSISFIIFIIMTLPIGRELTRINQIINGAKNTDEDFF